MQYTDKKRYLWLASMFYPLFAFTGIGLYLLTGSQLMFAVPLIMLYTGTTLLDWLIGQDTSNPPEEVVPELEKDQYYRWLPLLTVPMHVIVLITMAWFVATAPINFFSVIALALTCGYYSGLGINTAHELGHKKAELEQWAAKVALAVSGYGHFCIEHNRGHHRYVATPEDPASSKMGENIYSFACREIPGAWKRGWAVEKERLERKGLPAWHYTNEILQSYAMTILLQGGLIIAFGWIMIPFLVIQNFFAWWQLTSANYIEHYGLLRDKKPDGKYEVCQPHHSWNADYVVSNLLLFQLERHSDHHAHPTRHYQSLRSFPDLPTLPTGYAGMFFVSLFPPLWYKIMDKRLLNLPHVNYDFKKINILPSKRKELWIRYSPQTLQ